MGMLAAPSLEKFYYDKLKSIPKSSTLKMIKFAELERHFTVLSMQDLIFTLKQYQYAGLLEFSVFISQEYLDYEQANLNQRLNGRPIPDFAEPLSALMRRKQFPIAVDDTKIQGSQPLTQTEIDNVLRSLPTILAEKFMRFQIKILNRQQMNDIIKSNSVEQVAGVKIDGYVAVTYKGLTINGASASYNNKIIKLNRRQIELLRYLIIHHETDIAPDQLIYETEIFKSDKSYENPHSTLSKLISETHSLLKPFTGECIFNTPQVGWQLHLT